MDGKAGGHGAGRDKPGAYAMGGLYGPADRMQESKKDKEGP